jgi:hypothetical protein
MRNAITSLQYKVHDIQSDALSDEMFSEKPTASATAATSGTTSQQPQEAHANKAVATSAQAQGTAKEQAMSRLADKKRDEATGQKSETVHENRMVVPTAEQTPLAQVGGTTVGNLQRMQVFFLERECVYVCICVSFCARILGHLDVFGLLHDI